MTAHRAPAGRLLTPPSLWLLLRLVAADVAQCATRQPQQKRCAHVSTTGLCSTSKQMGHWYSSRKASPGSPSSACFCTGARRSRRELQCSAVAQLAGGCRSVAVL